jgi:uncharacterized protein
VAIVYFDASAFVKLLVEEDGSDLAVALWDGADLVVASRLAHPEVRAAQGAAHRLGRLDRAQLKAAERLWAEYWRAVRPVELTEGVADHAGDLAARHALRGSDAIHLASALVLGQAGVIVAVWDRRLHQGAAAAGLAVAPARLA